MKSFSVLVPLSLLIDVLQATSRVVTIHEHAAGGKKSSPVTRVVNLLTELKAGIEDDGKKELASYDKYACWCEETLKRKVSDMDAAKESLKTLQASITKNNAEVSAHQAAIANLKTSIKDNFESQNDATELRAKENAEFEKSKTEFESCIGAVTAASKVLDGAGTGKTGFLGTLQEAQMIGVLAGMKRVMTSSLTAKSLSTDDLDVMSDFVKKPEEFVGNRLSGFSAAQIAHNPFGDYAPKSTRIQGILKELAATFTADLKTATDDEATAVAEYQSLMATKTKEAKTLQKTLDIEELSSSSKSEQVAQDRTELDETASQLDADETFFAETKQACQEKAKEFAERTRVRTEELHGIGAAVGILSSPEATAIFGNSSATLFLQVHSNSDNRRQKAYAALKKISMKFPSLSIAQVAAAVNTGGHFDKVIVMIDEMMKVLRAEEAEDITHRDLCQSKQNANSNEIEDLNHDITKAGEAIGRMETSIGELDNEITTLTTAVNKSKADLQTLLTARNEESAQSIQNLKFDTDAIALLEKAITYLTNVYTNNKLQLGGFMQRNYTSNPDKAPETWSGGYTGRSSESGGIVSILSMIKEDIQKEIMVGREEDAAAEAEYEKMRSSLQESLDSQEALKVAKEKARSMLKGEKADASSAKDDKAKDLVNENGVKSALEIDCEWVTQTFTSRREKRKMEMDGLVEAKAFLAGIDAGEPVIPTL